MSSVYKLANNNYKAIVDYYEAGKRRQKTKQGFKTKTLANGWILEREIELKNNNPRGSHILLSDYFKKWVETFKVNVAPQTMVEYVSTLNSIKKELPNAYLDDFSRADFQNYVNRLAIDKTKETVKKRKGQLTSALRDAFAERLISHDPTFKIVVSGKDGKEKDDKFLEHNQIEQLIKITANNPESQIDSIIYTALISGMRIGEIRALEYKDIDFKNQKISITKSADISSKKVRKPKTKSSKRIITMPSEWFELVKQVKEHLKDDYTFKHTNRIFYVEYQKINRELRRILNKNNLKEITPHGLRHSHASWLLSKGVDINYISERLGHSDVSITLSVYSHLLNNKRVEEEEKTNQALKF